MWPPIRQIRAACGWDNDYARARLDMRQLLAAGAAVFLGGCGVDYQKCEAIKSAMASAHAAEKDSNSIAYENAMAPYVEKECTQAELVKLAKEFGYNESNMITPLYKTLCKTRVGEKYVTEIAERQVKDPIAIDAASRLERVVADYKWNRCS